MMIQGFRFGSQVKIEPLNLWVAHSWVRQFKSIITYFNVSSRF